MESNALRQVAPQTPRSGKQVEVEINALSKSFQLGDRVTNAVEGLSMIAFREEVVCILGPSGCGKSTVLNIVGGFIHADAGAVRVAGKPVTSPGRDRVMVFQAPVLLPWLTVSKNVSFALRRANKDSECLVQQTLKNVGLESFSDHYPYQLSGGMKQRAQIARALVMKPQVLLLDEPFGALDALTRIQMQQMLQEIIIAYKPTIMFVTHDVDEAIFVADRIYVMSARPSQVREEIVVPWSRPRNTSIREDPNFGRLSARILRLLGL